MTVFPQPWFNSSSAVQPAEAETYAPSAPLPGEEATVQLTASGTGYRLYLGTYRSELAARLTWAGLEADAGTMLTGIDPSFTPSDNEQDPAFYHVLAGKSWSFEEANKHCSQLKDYGVICSIVSN